MFCFAFCFFLIRDRKLLKEFNVGSNISNLGCYLKLQLMMIVVERNCMLFLGPSCLVDQDKLILKNPLN